MADIEILIWRVFVRPFKRKKRCPSCLSRVLFGARICRYCRHEF